MKANKIIEALKCKGKSLTKCAMYNKSNLKRHLDCVKWWNSWHFSMIVQSKLKAKVDSVLLQGLKPEKNFFFNILTCKLDDFYDLVSLKYIEYVIFNLFSCPKCREEGIHE